MLCLFCIAPVTAGEEREETPDPDPHVGYGPLSVRLQSASQSLRLGILPRTPSTFGPREQQIRVGATWTNIWAVSASGFDPATGDFGDRLLDFETLDGHISYTYGLSRRVQLEAEYEQRWRFSGTLDGAIENFHDLFGIDQNGRDLSPRNDFRIFLHPEKGGGPVDLGADFEGSYTRNLLLTFSHNLTEGDTKWPTISYSMTGRYSDADGSDAGWDGAMSVGASRRFGRFYAYLSLGYARYSNDTFYGIELPDSQLTALAAGEWRFKPRMSLILEWVWMRSSEMNSDFFPEIANQIIFGRKWELRPSGVLELGMLQNAVPYDASPDFGLHAAFTQRF